MTHRPCPTDDQLRAFQTGSAPEGELDTVAAHIRTCLSCLGRLERLGVPEDPVLTALRGMPRGPAAEQGTPDDPAYLRALRSLTGAEPEVPARPVLGPGAVLGEYKLVERLGEGGMGVVWKAVHNRLGKPVALKMIHRRRLGDPEAVARFEREMKAVGRLDHSNIVRATDAGESRGVHFLVMEFVEGVNLSRLVKAGGPLPVREACALIVQAAAGLQYAHEAGLIHRDVKPSNLIRGVDGTVKLLDLGLARLAGDAEQPAAAQAEAATSPGASDVTSASRVIGTLHYMAPEQQRDAHAVDARADVYGLGATLWFLLTGSPPTGEPPGPGPLPGALPAAVWGKLLAAEPSARYESAAAVAAALAPYAGAAEKRRDRRAWFALAAALVAVGVAVPGVLQPWRDRSAGPVQTDNGSDRSTDANTSGKQAVQTAVANPLKPRVGELPMTPEEAKALQAGWAKEIGLPVELTDRSGMRLVLVPPGEYVLAGECRVRITRPYYVGACEVTVGEFRAFVTATGHKSEIESTGGRYLGGATPGHDVNPDRRFNWKTPGHETVTDDRPVTQVSWRDAARFCEWKTKQEGVTYRLPTEVEWVWAARAGNPITHLPQGNREWDALAWCKMNATEPQPVGRLRANPWGLHDVFGNVSEWCHDFYGEHPSKKQTLADWAGPEGHELGRHVFVGTPYISPVPLRFDFRDSIMEWTGNSYLGFRVVREATAPRPKAEAPKPGRLPMSTAEAQRFQKQWADHLGRPPFETNSIGMKLALIPPGEFHFVPPGAPPGSPAAVGYTPVISKPYEIGVTEVTVGQFREFVTAKQYRTEAELSGRGGLLPKTPTAPVIRDKGLVWHSPGYPEATDGHPVTQVCWHDAVEFCRWLSEKEGRTYRLPSEAEWHWACRAGSAEPLSANGLAGMAHYATDPQQPPAQPRAVARLRANAWGLFDMYGNVAEWGRDFADQFSPAKFPPGQRVVDPVTTGGTQAITLGGNYTQTISGLGSRRFVSTRVATSGYGFRVVREVGSK